MSTKHTPGPWQAGLTERGTATVRSSSGAVCSFDWRDPARRWADANLVAAAPELLEALYMTRRQLAKLSFKDGEISAAIEAAYRAIAKATGSAE